MNSVKQSLSTCDFATSWHFLCVESPNADSAPRLPFEPGCARAGSVFHPSHCLRLEMVHPVKG